MDFGPSELLLILGVVLLLFGGSRIPQLAGSLGKAQREFRRGVDGDADDEAALGLTAATVKSE